MNHLILFLFLPLVVSYVLVKLLFVKGYFLLEVFYVLARGCFARSLGTGFVIRRLLDLFHVCFSSLVFGINKHLNLFSHKLNLSFVLITLALVFFLQAGEPPLELLTFTNTLIQGFPQANILLPRPPNIGTKDNGLIPQTFNLPINGKLKLGPLQTHK